MNALIFVLDAFTRLIAVTDQETANDLENKPAMLSERGNWHACLDNAWRPNSANDG
ncbi:hypothetical protein BSU04_07380 [Caballeronia sordidicola]|uniref:Uncharacterized protein n=1 Tax=Caballeronia sordidicola TaxID=196367 RepID=A0A226X795_CABSO|nr:hypothetical protein BSU04_07380 [Caballeronia sordidicola]